MGAWSNDTAWSGSGGGIVTTAALPAYQVNANPANAELSGANRNIPDVSMPARSIYIVTSNCNGVDSPGMTGQVIGMNPPIPVCPAAQLTGGIERSVGGTSASAPLWAGFMALVTSWARMRDPSIGFANPAFYQIGRDPVRYPASFHDVTAGNTTNTCASPTPRRLATTSPRAGARLSAGPSPS